MKSVGIRDFKNNLNKYLHLAKAGETIVITEHEQVIAEIKKPSEFLNDLKKRSYIYLEEQNRIGKIKLAKRNQSQIDSILKRYTRKMPRINWGAIRKDSRTDRLTATCETQLRSLKSRATFFARLACSEPKNIS
ncbi:toxin-antitoxin system, antitoxin component, PHD domain protein [Leptospira weilii str. 2006001853]|uniref:Antitoxin n=1 Tax=Leptospira weilii str. 2006001853 TaxID=1001589 RepID=A0A828Z2A9_9LEPT|nr:type II toxin-antitoxin system Phd/YefM family antitoxin [Leptospira weilii]EKR65399.1 toxin-antitoxin system, antitoxin component, PHD domain protein [Leptospira weilii str. 2006001853]MCL8268103.1 type II toxin-antitoxin system Phd/YefM family antitoxin [Leptospira weilii]QDK21867.1 toxin-antitoxin system, antitoxin component, PHD domain protein [Leptospira weilii]QDK25805.1 toxin-antitoxin system, antitoxin component, PHD domain protein [Leptospira weilii]